MRIDCFDCKYSVFADGDRENAVPGVKPGEPGYPFATHTCRLFDVTRVRDAFLMPRLPGCESGEPKDENGNSCGA